MKEREEQRGKVKQSLFPVSLFGIYIGVLFLMSGIHTGLIVFMNSAGWNKAVMTVVPMCYWGMVAMGLTLFTRWKVKRTYEEPLYKMAEATRKVANGDFSVYVPTFHTMEKRDYLDVMIPVDLANLFDPPPETPEEQAPRARKALSAGYCRTVR